MGGGGVHEGQSGWSRDVYVQDTGGGGGGAAADDDGWNIQINTGPNMAQGSLRVQEVQGTGRQRNTAFQNGQISDL